MIKKFKHSAALVLAVVMLLGMLAGCSEPAPAAPEELTGCTVEVKSAGGKALEGVGVYVYADAAKTDMIDFVRTDANGIATISHSVPVGGVAVLDKVPEGYAAQESYAITTAKTQISLQIQLRQEIGQISLGDVMFDFTVTDTNGTAHTLSELLKTKKAVVVNLWYVNCNPCKMEFPYLIEAYGKYSDDIEVLAINPEGDDEAAIAEFVTQYGLTFPTAKGEGAWTNTIATLSYPTTIIIDRFGTVGLIHTGGIDSAKVFEDAFAYFTAEDYTQSTVANIMDVYTPGDPVAPTEPTEPTEATNPTETAAPTEATNPAATSKPTEAPTQKPTAAPTEKPTEATKPTEAPKPTESAGPNTNGTLVNPEEPIEQYGFTDYSVEVGAGEKVLIYMIRTMNKATFCIEDADAYVVYNGKTYTPTNGKIQIKMESKGSFTPLELEIGNSGSAKKTFDVKFYFDAGTRENPIKLKQGDNTVSCAAGNDQGTFYTFEATKAGTLTLTVKSIDPAAVLLGINVSDMQEIPTVVELEEGSTSLSINLPAGAVAEITFSTSDPDKEWKIPAAEVVISATFA